MYFAIGVAFLLFVIAVSSIKILREYERGVVFFLGRFHSVMGPGLIIVVPPIQQMVRVDLRTRVFDVPPQDVISRDNVSVKVNAVVYFRVVDPQLAIIQVANFNEATSQLAQTTLRAILGKHELDELLAEREKLNSDIQEVLDKQTDAWGIKVSNVEIKHVDINETMIRAIARQAEAERERRPQPLLWCCRPCCRPQRLRWCCRRGRRPCRCSRRPQYLLWCCCPCRPRRSSRCLRRPTASRSCRARCR